MRLWLGWSLDPATLADFFFCPAVGLFLTCEYLAGIVVVDDEDH